MRKRRTQIPRAAVAGLVIAVVLDTIAQVAWKRSVADVPAAASFAVVARTVLGNPYFYGAMLAFGAQLYNWVRVLALVDLSFAQPFTALSYLTVLAISRRALHEDLSAGKIVGVGLILAGVFFISRTPFRTHETGTTSRALP
ncbi:MAG TPA: EamA family transporter [Opitutaceae bacterium]|nr:EamA family transporter [Opitutaceae bacterium]